MIFQIKSLPAYCGDSIIVSFGVNDQLSHILIDGGMPDTYDDCLKNELLSLPGIDLLVVTHVDEDHIGGVIEIFANTDVVPSLFRRIWFNSERLLSANPLEPKPDRRRKENRSNKVSADDSSMLEQLLLCGTEWTQEIIHFSKVYSDYGLNGATLTVLTPRFVNIAGLEEEAEGLDRKVASVCDYNVPIEDLWNANGFSEDRKLSNRTSISFLLTYKDQSVLFLGDAHPSDVEASLRDMKYHEGSPLMAEIVKVSHHGSKRNTSPALLNLIRCKRFIISTDGASHYHPHKECLARIVKSQGDGVTFYFNYPDIAHRIFTEEEIRTYQINCVYKPVIEVAQHGNKKEI